MSRCYPYPPPGYEKKAYVEPPLSPKRAQKEKHKHKDKKKKRRRDSEANGDVRPRDKDKRSKRDHRAGDDSKGLSSLANGSLSNAKATTSVVVGHGTLLQALQGSFHGEKVLVNGDTNNTREGLEPSCTVDTTMLSISFRATSSNGATANDPVPRSKAVCEIEDELSRQGRDEFMPHVERVWSAVDDQEWLFLCDNELRLGRKKEKVNEETPHVCDKAILLPSVGVYALPYVIPE